MRPPLIISLFCFILSSPQAQARDVYGCPRFEAPEITVNIITAPPKINHDNDLSGIRRIADNNKKDIALGDNEIPVGLTSAAMSLGTQYRIMTAKSQKDPMVCSQMTKLEIDYGFEETTIYMPTELKRHTCSYQAVLRHEYKHVNTDRAFIKRTAPRLRKELKKIAKKLGVVRSGSTKFAQKKISKELDKKVKALGKKYSAQRRKWQKRVDTPQEYKRIGKSCGGRLNKIITKAQGLWK